MLELEQAVAALNELELPEFDKFTKEIAESSLQLAKQREECKIQLAKQQEECKKVESQIQTNLKTMRSFLKPLRPTDQDRVPGNAKRLAIKERLLPLLTEVITQLEGVMPRAPPPGLQ